MSNTLFQLGWMELSDNETYPGEEEGQKQFDEMLQSRIKEWMEEEDSDPKEQSAGFRKMQTILLNWADAVRHSSSALELRPDNEDAKQNGIVARKYLEKLRQKMEGQQQEMQAQMQGQGEEEGPEPGQGQGDGDEDGEGEGKEPKDGKNKNDGDNDGDGNKNPNGKTPEGEKPDPNNTHGKDQKPGETKEQKALRKLNENADLQRGIVAPGRHEYRRPAKDW